ncbi:MAG: hypothetical protein NT062_32440 [Proteobacteria bacterium]|nr:hypothetical protein [Pseudomonadota bacterium]
MRRRVWCETLPYDALAALAPPLVRGRIELLLAVRPWQLDEIGPLVDRLRGEGVYVGLWPMLADDDGRWASVASCAKFLAFADAVLARAPLADELVVDLEPPFATLARWKAGRPTWRRAPGEAYAIARTQYRLAIQRWHLTHRVTTAILPMLALEGSGQWLQQLIGTPVSDLPVDAHSMMAYTSLFEGWSGGFIGRRRAELSLAACARLARTRFGDRAALSLGTVGTGAFGDEPAYRDAAELARDVAIARAAGITELAVFDLGGIVRRGPIEPWFAAFGE